MKYIPANSMYISVYRTSATSVAQGISRHKRMLRHQACAPQPDNDYNHYDHRPTSTMIMKTTSSDNDDKTTDKRRINDIPSEHPGTETSQESRSPCLFHSFRTRSRNIVIEIAQTKSGTEDTIPCDSCPSIFITKSLVGDWGFVQVWSRYPKVCFFWFSSSRATEL